MIPVSTWFDALNRCQQQGKAYVLVTLLASAGSTPRNSGSKMLVCDDSTFDTIGGGHLEFHVTEHARALLLCNSNVQQVQHYPLSSKLGQCCGGATNVLFEVFSQHSQHLAIYGAGHVARALVPILAQLPLQISWLDNRPAMLEEIQGESLANNVSLIHAADPAHSVKQLQPNTWLLIMTHNHQIDFALVEAALGLEHNGFIGMIGSDTKARRFRTRLAHKGYSQAQIQLLHSPVGLLDIPGKLPIQVAVSIAAQLIRLLEPTPADPQQKKQAWRDNKQLISALVKE